MLEVHSCLYASTYSVDTLLSSRDMAVDKIRQKKSLTLPRLHSGEDVISWGNLPILHIHLLSFLTADIWHIIWKGFKDLVLVQISSVAQLWWTLCDPMNHSTPGLPVHHQLLEFTQTHIHWVGDAIQPSHPLSSPSPPALNLSQHQGLFKWVSSSHQVAQVLEFQLQHQSFLWTPRTDLP